VAAGDEGWRQGKGARRGGIDWLAVGCDEFRSPFVLVHAHAAGGPAPSAGKADEPVPGALTAEGRPTLSALWRGMHCCGVKPLSSEHERRNEPVVSGPGCAAGCKSLVVPASPSSFHEPPPDLDALSGPHRVLVRAVCRTGNHDPPGFPPSVAFRWSADSRRRRLLFASSAPPRCTG
jgi:hypothetical protein